MKEMFKYLRLCWFVETSADTREIDEFSVNRFDIQSSGFALWRSEVKGSGGGQVVVRQREVGPEIRYDLFLDKS